MSNRKESTINKFLEFPKTHHDVFVLVIWCFVLLFIVALVFLFNFINSKTIRDFPVPQGDNVAKFNSMNENQIKNFTSANNDKPAKTMTPQQIKNFTNNSNNTKGNTNSLTQDQLRSFTSQ